jgi:hypothetical protein
MMFRTFVPRVPVMITFRSDYLKASRWIAVLLLGG